MSQSSLIVQKLRNLGITVEIVKGLKYIKELEGTNMENHVLAEQYRDVYQKTLLYLFENVPVLKRNSDCLYWEERSLCFEYTELLDRASRGWSATEVWLLELANHLYCNRGAVNLRVLDYADPKSLEIAMTAISMRYGYKQ